MSDFDPSLTLVLASAILVLCLLIFAAFATILHRRKSVTEAELHRASSNLWFVREITTCFAGSSPSGDARLREVVDAASLEVIVHLLRIQRGELRGKLLDIAGKLGKFDCLISELKSPDSQRRLSALHMLEVCGVPKCAAAVLHLARTEGCPKVRLNAIATLLEMGVRVSLEEAIDLIDNSGATLPTLYRTILRRIALSYNEKIDDLLVLAEVDHMRPHLALMLDQVPERRALTTLISLAGDSCPITRRNALESLAHFAHPDSRPAAINALADPVEEVGFAALKLMRAIDSRPAVAPPTIPIDDEGSAAKQPDNVVRLRAGTKGKTKQKKRARSAK